MTMITTTQDYFVIQHVETKQIWDGKAWRTPVDRLDILMSQLDPDDLENDYSEQSANITNDPDDYEIANVTIETNIRIY